MAIAHTAVRDIHPGWWEERAANLTSHGSKTPLIYAWNESTLDLPRARESGGRLKAGHAKAAGTVGFSKLQVLLEILLSSFNS